MLLTCRDPWKLDAWLSGRVDIQGLPRVCRDAIFTLPIMEGVDRVKRIIANVDAQSKSEAIAALEILLETIKTTDYDGGVNECVMVENEGNTANN